jgi:hypothetical protein
MGKIVIDVIGAQPLEAQLAAFGDMLGREIACSAINAFFRKERTDLGDDNRLITAAEFVQRAAEDFLGETATIAFSCIDEIDPGIQGRLDHLAGAAELVRCRIVAVVAIVAARPGHRSKADNGNL